MDSPSKLGGLEHFSLKHFGAVSLCAALLLLITLMKGSLSLPSLKSHTSVDKPTLSYEEARRQVLAELGQSEQSSDSNVETINNQLALLDPQLSQGSAVLGASTGTPEDVADNSPITPQVLAQIPIHLLNQTNNELVAKYARDLVLVESNYDTTSWVLALSEQDKNILSSLATPAENLIADLGELEVPKDLEEFQKLKILYYGELAVIGDYYSGKQKQVNIEDILQIIFNTKNRLQELSTQINSQYGVELP